jgi:hypothetical protein
MNAAAQTIVAMALLRLMADDANREQLTRFLGLTVDPILPPRLAELLKELEETESARKRMLVILSGSRARVA